MDPSGQLNEFMDRLPTPADVTCMGLAQVRDKKKEKEKKQKEQETKNEIPGEENGKKKKENMEAAPQQISDLSFFRSFFFQVPELAQRSRFLAIGCADGTVRVVSLDPADCLQPLSMQVCAHRPPPICLAFLSFRPLFFLLFFFFLSFFLLL
jgi:hypothetical protein